MSSELGLMALSIAIRYAGVRRQFGPTNNESLLLDYPVHQFRLITKFSEHMVNFVAANRLVKLWVGNLPKLLEPGNTVTDLCHALSSNEKAFIAWRTQTTIADCRKACGGNGYSYYAMFGNILNFNDLHSTWEGDNHVLMMQTQKFLLKGLSLVAKKQPLPETLGYMRLNQTTEPKFTGSIESIEDLIKLFSQRASFLANKAAVALGERNNTEEAFLELQPFELKDMCEAYHDIYGMGTFTTFLKTFNCEATKSVFEKLLLLHIHTRIYENSGFFVTVLQEGDLDKVKHSINKNLKSLRNEIVKLTHVMPFPNRTMGPLGNEDMQVYERFIQHFKSAPKVTERPSWWKLAYVNSEQAKQS
jgi:acyl-CoA oxidase